MALALARLKIVLEPGGAVALAAALFRPAGDPELPVIAVATGGNVDPAVLRQSIDQLG
jgi:threonine dehydratase